MIAGHAGLAKAAELTAREEAVRCAEVNGQCPAHLFIGVDRLLELLPAECTARCHDGKAVCSCILICLCMSDQLIPCKEGVGIDARLMASRLRAVFAVLSTAAAAAVNDRAQINVIAAELFLEAICSFAQLLDRRVHKDRAVILTGEAISCNNAVGKLSNTAFAHKKIPALQ